MFFFSLGLIIFAEGSFVGGFFFLQQFFFVASVSGKKLQTSVFDLKQRPKLPRTFRVSSFCFLHRIDAGIVGNLATEPSNPGY